MFIQSSKERKMSNIIEKFDITRCQRLSQLNEKIIKQYEYVIFILIYLGGGQLLLYLIHLSLLENKLKLGLFLIIPGKLQL